jgi:hypothetical protein
VNIALQSSSFIAGVISGEFLSIPLESAAALLASSKRRGYDTDNNYPYALKMYSLLVRCVAPAMDHITAVSDMPQLLCNGLKNNHPLQDLHIPMLNSLYDHALLWGRTLFEATKNNQSANLWLRFGQFGDAICQDSRRCGEIMRALLTVLAVATSSSSRDVAPTTNLTIDFR